MCLAGGGVVDVGCDLDTARRIKLRTPVAMKKLARLDPLVLNRP
jgi:hypothetical protein